MAVNRDPILKRCRALDLSPAVLGYDKKSNRNPNGNKRKKESEYASQLKEKQKLKFIYGVLEKQFIRKLYAAWREAIGPDIKIALRKPEAPRVQTRQRCFQNGHGLHKTRSSSARFSRSFLCERQES